MPTSGSSIMSVPQNRFDEVQEIVNTEDIIYENVSVDVYVVDRYVVYPEIVKDSMVYGGHTYLYESEEQSFVFRIICDQLVDVFGTESIKPKDTRVVIERLNGDMTAITEKSFKQYISERVSFID
jgi:hypothetical protein